MDDFLFSHGDRVMVLSLRRMMRRRLPDRRYHAIGDIHWQGHVFHVCVGFYADGRVGETFAKRRKEQAPMGAMADKFCIAVSRGLQHGCPAGEFTRDITLDPDGNPETPMDAVLMMVREFAGTVDIRPHRPRWPNPTPAGAT